LIRGNQTLERYHLELCLLRCRCLQHEHHESQRPRLRETFVSNMGYTGSSRWGLGYLADRAECSRRCRVCRVMRSPAATEPIYGEDYYLLWITLQSCLRGELTAGKTWQVRR